MSIFVLDAASMTRIISVPDVHSFPVTAIDFNPDATIVLSGSADGTIVAVRVPVFGDSSSVLGRTCWILVFAVFVILFFLTFMPLEDLLEGHQEL